MKKTTITLLAFGALVLAGCKKDRTCECTYTSTSTVGSNPSTTTTYSDTRTLTKISKSAAKDVCAKTTRDYTNASSSSTVVVTTSTTNDCKLK